MGVSFALGCSPMPLREKGGSFNLALLNYEMLNALTFCQAQSMLRWLYQVTGRSSALLGDIRLDGPARRCFTIERVWCAPTRSIFATGRHHIRDVYIHDSLRNRSAHVISANTTIKRVFKSECRLFTETSLQALLAECGWTLEDTAELLEVEDAGVCVPAKSLSFIARKSS
jgi:hypothetical protein